MKKLRQNVQFRRLVWTILVIILTYFTTIITDMPWEFAPVLALVMRELTKFINVQLLGDIGVETKD